MSQNIDQLMNGFPVDDCFGNGIGRGPLDNLAGGRVDGPAEMVTFEVEYFCLLSTILAKFGQN